MFHSENIQRMTKYILLSVLTLSWECFAAVNRDDNVYNFTTRRPNVGEQFTEPTHSPQFSDDSSRFVDETDMIVFFVVCSFSALFIGILIYILKRSKSTTSTTTSSLPRIPGATVHPPPSRLIAPTQLIAPTAPVVSYFNGGYQSDASTAVDGRPADGPPDYATVTIGDLATQDIARYPTVMPKLETPPPKYPVGHPFS